MTAETESRQTEIRNRNAAACPVIHAIDQVGTPWRMNVIYALKADEKRFNELKRATGARSKTLADVLAELTDSGIVVRRMEDGNPIAVYYSLTAKGTQLVQGLSGLEEWANDWVEADAHEPTASG